MAYNATYNHSNASNLHTPYNQSTANLNSSPYGSGDPYYNESTGFITPSNPKKGTSKWLKIGLPVAVVVIAAAVVGAIFGIRASKDSSSSSSSKSSSADSSGSSGSSNDGTGMFATATDSLYLLPIYPSTVRVYSIYDILGLCEVGRDSCLPAQRLAIMCWKDGLGDDWLSCTG